LSIRLDSFSLKRTLAGTVKLNWSFFGGAQPVTDLANTTSHPCRLAHLLFGLLVIFSLAVISPSQAYSWGGLTLDKAAANLARDLVRQGNLEGVLVLISPNDLTDASTGLSLPLANLLRDKMITEMKKNGARVLLPGADEDFFMLLQGTWKTQGGDLAIDLKVMRLTNDGPETIAAASSLVPLTNIDAKDLSPDRNAWARYLVRQLELKTLQQSPQTLYVSPFEGKGCADDFKHYLVNWLRPALADSATLIPLDQAKNLRNVSVTTLRTRGTRGISKEKKSDSNAHSLTADLLDAEMELKGTFYRHRDSIEIHVRITDRQGVQVTAAEVEVPTELFPTDLLKPPPVPKFTPNAATPNGVPGISVNGLKLELTTTRGEGRPYYSRGETIRFLLRLNRPAWVYLFDFNSAGEAVLLYPVDDHGYLANGRSGFLHAPEKPLILPEDGYSYELVAAPPFGTDRVLAVAAETPMNIPKDLAGPWSQADYLLDQLRLQGMKRQDGYAEAQVELVTGE
jgi:hypothetical protein